MDFFEAQDQARRSTSKLVVLFLLAVVGIVISLNIVALGAAYVLDNYGENQRRFEQARGQTSATVTLGEFDWFRPGLFALVTLGTIVVIGGSSLFKTAQLHGDGGKVARLLGGRKLDPNTNDDDERKLLNIVEEMSLASGVPVPDVYVMDREQGINAFAAGTDLDNAAVGVTRGTIEKLTRDELQGVIAHEYSHILNGDMKINLRLIGVVFGILVIGLLGYTIFRYAPYLMQSRGRSDKNNSAPVGLALLIVGGLVWLIGSIGVFFGRLIQASISRQREYLADASAVQFTRNPVGIRDALRKIGGNSSKARLHTPHAGECSHMFFADGFKSMFATHPPLEKRIKTIDPNWNGTMLKAEMVEERQQAEHVARQRQARPQNVFGPFGDILAGAGGHQGSHNPIASMLGAVAGAAAGADRTQTVAQRGGRSTRGSQARDFSAAGMTNRVGQLDSQHIEFAHLMAEAIPQELRAAARRPDLARGLVAALFYHDDQSVRVLQDEVIAQKDPEAASAADALADVVGDLGPAGRLPLLELCAPVLRQINRAEGERYLAMLRDMIEADQRVEPFEYALYKICTRLIKRPSIRERYSVVEHVAEAAQVVLSGLAAAGHDEPRSAAKAYKRGIAVLRQGDLPYLPNFQLNDFDRSLDRLAEAHMPVKKQFLESASATVAADGKVTVEEAELLRATAAVLQCPLPPFIDPAQAG